ncbi:MAG: hypothetical protein U0U33_10210 [Chitinophagaceae bacterium]
MAINKNHEFEELDGIKCAIVEKNASPERVAFLKELLEYNHFKVVVAATPPPKAAPAPKPVAAADGTAAPAVPPPPPPPPSTFTVGVTNVALNPPNAVYGLLLQTKNGHVVTPAYWLQKEAVSHDEIPYYEHN